MDILIKTKCDVPDRVKDEAVERLERAVRFFDQLIGVEAVFRTECNRPTAHPASVEVVARTRRHSIRAQASAVEHRAALDAAITRFERQLARYKTRLVDRRRAGARKAKASVTAGALPEPVRADTQLPASPA